MSRDDIVFAAMIWVGSALLVLAASLIFGCSAEVHEQYDVPVEFVPSEDMSEDLQEGYNPCDCSTANCVYYWGNTYLQPGTCETIQCSETSYLGVCRL